MNINRFILALNNTKIISKVYIVYKSGNQYSDILTHKYNE